jgi:transcriptional regulator NrdR family protein
LTGDYGQRWEFTDHPDIKWYRRVRGCLACEQLFTTAEIEEHVLWELVSLRIRVEELRKTIEVHKAAAKSASDALDQAAKSASDALYQLSSAIDAIAGVESKKADV